MRTITVQLPNGLVGPAGEVIREVTIRQLNGEDEDLIRDKKNLREGNIIDKLMKRVIVSIGPFDNEKDIVRMYEQKFLLADLTFLLVKLRIWGLDEIYRFDFTCPACDKISRQRIDLTGLECDEQDDTYRGQDRISTTVKDDDDKDVEIEFIPLYNKAMRMVQTINENYASEKGTRELMMQLKSYDGEPVRAPLLKKLSWRVRQRIRIAMDTAAGGIDTELEIQCPRCSRVAKATMPVDIRDFFFPTEDTSKIQTAHPFRASGMTSSSSDLNGDGHPNTFDDSPSSSDSGTPPA